MVVQWQVGCMLVEMQPGCCRVLELRMSLQKQSRLSASYWVMEVLQGGMPAPLVAMHASCDRGMSGQVSLPKSGVAAGEL